MNNKLCVVESCFKTSFPPNTHFDDFEIDHELTPKRVQVLARLKTLALVGNYSRNLRIEDFDWLDRGPKLVVSSKRK